MNEVLRFPPKSPKGHLDTEVFYKMTAGMDDAWHNAYAMIARGMTGLGKSYTIDEFLRGHEDGMVKVTLSEACASKTAGAAAIRKAFSPLIDGPGNVYWPTEDHRPARVMQDIRRFCRELSAHEGIYILLVLDEFQFAQPPLQNFVRSLWDPADGGQSGLFGLVMAGNTRLFNPVKGRMTEVDYAPLIRRCRHVLDFPAVPPGDIEQLIAHYKIVGAESKTLLTACGETGGLGEIKNIVEKAQEISGSPIVALKHLRAAAKTTGLSGATWLRRKKP